MPLRNACRSPRGSPMPWFPMSPIWVSSSIRRGWPCSIPIRKTSLPIWKIVGSLLLVGRHFPGGPGLPPEVPVSAGRLAVVSGNARARDRTGAGRFPGDGRPLHLLDPDRAVYRLGLGSRACFQALALSSLGGWSDFGAGRDELGVVCLATGVVLERRRDSMAAYVGLHVEKLVRPQQPRRRPGRPWADRRGHRPLPEGPGNQARL